MSLRDRLGLYGPNRPRWERETYEKIARSRVRWVVWRTDADPEAPRRLAAEGLEVIAQAPDQFSANPWADPAERAGRLHGLVRHACPEGTPVAVDNEPQLHPRTASQWHAEQYTRYLRALHAQWRWLDPASTYPLLAPALANGPDRHGDEWHRVAMEPEEESDGYALHAYWQSPGTMLEPDFGAPWLLVPSWPDPMPLYVLEYGNTTPGLGHANHLAEYETWLRQLHTSVRCACLFILDGTPDWQDFAITEPVLDWLASLED